MGAEHYTALSVLGIDPPEESTGRAKLPLYPNGLKAEIEYNILASSNSFERARSAWRLIEKVRRNEIDDTIESARALILAVLAFRAGARKRQSRDDATLINELERLVVDHITRENALAMSDMIHEIKAELTDGANVFGWRVVGRKMMMRILAQGFVVATVESASYTQATTTVRRGTWPTMYTIDLHGAWCEVGMEVIVPYPLPMPDNWQPGRDAATFSEVKEHQKYRPLDPLLLPTITR